MSIDLKNLLDQDPWELREGPWWDGWNLKRCLMNIKLTVPTEEIPFARAGKVKSSHPYNFKSTVYFEGIVFVTIEDLKNPEQSIKVWVFSFEEFKEKETIDLDQEPVKYQGPAAKKFLMENFSPPGP